MRRALGTISLVAGVTVALACGVVAGAAAASPEPTPPAPAGIASRPGGIPSRGSQVDFAVNAHGETFGSAMYASSPEEEPDLILVQLVDGALGYVRKADLDAVDGGAVASPAEAIAHQASRAQLRAAGPVIPVYAEDGVTKIGEFAPLG